MHKIANARGPVSNVNDFLLSRATLDLEAKIRTGEENLKPLWFIVSYDSANKQKHHKSHRMQ